MKIIHTKYFPVGRYATINLFGVLFTKLRNPSPVTLNHEAIHTAQMREMLFIPFYLWYVVEFIVRLLLKRNWHKAYRSVSLEREAYDFQGYFHYLEDRRCFSWLRKL